MTIEHQMAAKPQRPIKQLASKSAGMLLSSTSTVTIY